MQFCGLLDVDIIAKAVLLRGICMFRVCHRRERLLTREAWKGDKSYAVGLEPRAQSLMTLAGISIGSFSGDDRLNTSPHSSGMTVEADSSVTQPARSIDADIGEISTVHDS